MFIHSLADEPAFVIQCAVLFFIYHFELGLKQAKHGILKPFGLNFCPMVEIIAGQPHFVHGFFMPGMCIQATLAHSFVELVEFVGNGVLCRLLRRFVDLCVNSLAFFGIGFAEVVFVQCDNAVNMDLFFFVIQSPDILCALKKHVFQIMRQTRRFSGVVFASRTHGDFGIKTRFFVVFSEINCETIIELVNMYIHRIVGIGRINARKPGEDR